MTMRYLYLCIPSFYHQLYPPVKCFDGQILWLKCLVIQAVDLDIQCVYMTYLNLSLYGIPAVIIHGNAITLEEYDRWYTPVYLMDRWVWKEPMLFGHGGYASNEMLKMLDEPMYWAFRQVERLLFPPHKGDADDWWWTEMSWRSWRRSSKRRLIPPFRIIRTLDQFPSYHDAYAFPVSSSLTGPVMRTKHWSPSVVPGVSAQRMGFNIIQKAPSDNRRYRHSWHRVTLATLR